MIDTHTHLYEACYGENASEAILKGLEKGINHFILPNIDADSLNSLKDIHKKFSNFTSIAIGLHPTEIKEDYEIILNSLEKEIIKGDCVAIGEIGMDLYWDTSTKSLQQKAFFSQLKLAEKENLPVIIHCRNALEETLEIIAKANPKIELVFHSFTGNKEDVKKIREICDPYFGINGVVTYKNAQELREALKEIGINRILLETDSPYLSPVPFRGKKNESANLYYICKQVAEELNIRFEEAERITDAKARKVFRL